MKKSIAIFFISIFIALISAPTVILSMDNSIDTSFFFSINEEEENESHKLVFEYNFNYKEALFFDTDKTDYFEYKAINYSKPNLNLFSPPPELI